MPGILDDILTPILQDRSLIKQQQKAQYENLFGKLLDATVKAEEVDYKFKKESQLNTQRQEFDMKKLEQQGKNAIALEKLRQKAEGTGANNIPNTAFAAAGNIMNDNPGMSYEEALRRASTASFGGQITLQDTKGVQQQKARADEFASKFVLNQQGGNIKLAEIQEQNRLDTKMMYDTYGAELITKSALENLGHTNTLKYEELKAKNAVSATNQKFILDVIKSGVDNSYELNKQEQLQKYLTNNKQIDFTNNLTLKEYDGILNERRLHIRNQNNSYISQMDNKQKIDEAISRQYALIETLWLTDENGKAAGVSKDDYANKSTAIQVLKKESNMIQASMKRIEEDVKTTQSQNQTLLKDRATVIKQMGGSKARIQEKLSDKEQTQKTLYDNLKEYNYGR